MKWRKLEQDVLGALLLPFIVVGVALGFGLFLAVGWIAVVATLFLERYSDYDGYYGNLVGHLGLLWLVLVFGEGDEAAEVAGDLRDEVRDF